MNVINGLETTPGMFQVVVYSCVAMSLASYLVFYGYYRYWPTQKHQQRMNDMKALKYTIFLDHAWDTNTCVIRDILIHHIDGLDDLLSALHERRHIARLDFNHLVQQNVKGPALSQAEVDLLYRVFYTNREGLLEAGEKLIWPSSRIF